MGVNDARSISEFILASSKVELNNAIITFFEVIGMTKTVAIKAGAQNPIDYTRRSYDNFAKNFDSTIE